MRVRADQALEGPLFVVLAVLTACRPQGGDGDTDSTEPTDSPSVTDSTPELVCDAAVQAPGAVAEAPWAVPWVEAPTEWSWERFGLRAVDLSGTRAITLSVDGPFVAYDEQGAAVADALTAPATLWLQATGAGVGSLQITQEGCEPVAAELRAQRPVALAGESLGAFPHFTGLAAFNAGQPVVAALDPSRFPARVGAQGRWVVVPSRDGAEWADDLELTEVASVAVEVSGDGLAANREVVWASPPDPAGLQGDYDLVFDADADGRLSAGDLVDGLSGPGFSVFTDLSAPGPHPVTTTDVSASFWITQRVYYPTDVDTLSDVPMVVISHGNGHEHTWYDDLGEHLASWGYAVMSHRNDTQPGVVSASITTLDNVEAFVGALATFDGGALDGHVDPTTQAWIGHSRGGEGILIAYHDLFRGATSRQGFDHTHVKLLSSIAPTVFLSPVDANPHTAVQHLISGSADGDITGGVSSFGARCGVCQSWRLLQPGAGPKVVTYVQGATHNDFNCCGADDGAFVNAPQVGRTEVQQIARATYLAVLEHGLRGNGPIGAYLSRSPAVFRPPQADAVYTTQYLPAGGVLVLDDFQTQADPTVASSGAVVSYTVENLVEGRLDDGNGNFTWLETDPMNGMTQSDGDPDTIAARGQVFDVDGEAEWRLELPAELQDVTPYQALSLRATQGTRHPNTVALSDWLTFGIALVDVDGDEAVVSSASYAPVTQPHGRVGLGNGVGWANEFSTIRVPLEDFAADGSEVDLTRIAAVRLVFGGGESATARVGIDDLRLEAR
ncbi:MAG: hypothetical protein KTR31_07830 [Myxococcales bacterium]|nr:hypothetical protein [Myxococcales bacterium]